MGKIVVPQTLNHLEGIIFRGGVLKRELNIDGNKRTFSYYLPKNLKKNASIIILAHGSYCNGDIMRTSTAYEFEEKAEENNSIIVYPDSYGPYWNDGRLGRIHIARELKIDESRFFKKIIEYIVSIYNSSRENIYFGGFSNGGALGYKLSQEDIFKRMALWCINLPSLENRSYKIEDTPPIMIINNREDMMVPFEGGDLLGADGMSRGSFESTYDSFLHISKEKKLPKGVETHLYTEYTLGENKLIEVKMGGHVIPHPNTFWPVNLGRGSLFNSVERVLEFFLLD